MNIFKFGPHLIPESQIFYRSTHCVDVLVVSKRLAARFNDLTSEEAADLVLSAQKISKIIENHYQGTSLTFVIQDGPEAGQTVPHVHMHVIPRRKGDYANNDDIYDDIDERKQNKNRGVDNESRTPRSAEDMKTEADALRSLFY
ncbi:unnamed protein product [Cunninghamella blakesleeana]